MNIQEIRAIVSCCTHPEYTFNVLVDHRGAIYLQGSYWEDDVKTGEKELQ